MKSKSELQEIITKIAAADSPVGMDAVYVHALILDTLNEIKGSVSKLESRIDALETAPSKNSQSTAEGS